MAHLFKLVRLGTILSATIFCSLVNNSFAQSQDVVELQWEVNDLKKEIEKLKKKTPESVTNNRLNELEVAMEETQDKVGSRALAHADRKSVV